MSSLFLRFSTKKQTENKPYRRLNKEELRKKRKGEIETYEFQPVGKQRPHGKTGVIRVIDTGGDQAHRRTHNRDRTTDDDALKQRGMRFLRIEVFDSQTERKRTSQEYFQRVRKRKLNQYDCPNRQVRAKRIDPSLRIDGVKHAVRARDGHERCAVDDVDAVKHVSVYGYYNGYECIGHSLKLILQHTSSIKK